MSSVWWLALPLLLLPLWWHRQRREQAGAPPLATARFLPQADPLRLRVWRLRDRGLLLVRCLLLALVIAWLAGWVLPWRGNAVLLAPGTEQAWAEQQIKAAGFADADRVPLATRDVFGWLARHEAEWQDNARLLVVGDVAMPAQRPRLKHEVLVRARVDPPLRAERHVAIVSPRAQQWKQLFAAVDGPWRYRVDAQPGPQTDLMVWDRPDPPPAANGLRVLRATLPQDANAARALFETLQRQHFEDRPYTTPSQPIAANPRPGSPGGHAQHYLLTLALMALFAIERMIAHASSR